MALPKRAFFTLHETASRWGCTIADIGGWASEGKLDIVTGISLATCGSEKVSGKITISPMDMLPFFRRSGTGPTVIKLQRIKPDDLGEWCYVTDPSDGVEVSIADLLISGKVSASLRTITICSGASVAGQVDYPPMTGKACMSRS